MICNLKNILTLNILHSEITFLSIFNLIAPYANEFANLFTITKILNLYPHHAVTNIDLIKKTLFDIFALFGIVSNAIVASHKYNFKMGLIKGILYLIFAFMIPNLFMHNILNSKYLKNYKLLSGLCIVYLLEISTLTLFCFFQNIFYTPNKKNENENENENYKKHN